MKRVICTICLMIISGCTETTPYSHYQPRRQQDYDYVTLTKTQEQQEEERARAEIWEQRAEELSEQEKESMQRFGHKFGLAEPPSKKIQPRKSSTRFDELSQAVDKGLKDGIFHSVDPIIYEARMDPLVWSLLPIESKRATIELFVQYFNLYHDGVGGIATIRSKYSDEKLGGIGWLGGYKIYK